MFTLTIALNNIETNIELKNPLSYKNISSYLFEDDTNFLHFKQGAEDIYINLQNIIWMSVRNSDAED